MTKKAYDAKVGIFMPAYNQGQYIDEALQSLKEQTFQDFIVHIVDDGSNDNTTPDKLASIEYNKARYFPNKANKGVAYRARQHYKMLNTEFILVLCADDRLAPTFLEKTVQYLDEHPKHGAVSVNILEYQDDFDREPFYTFIYDEKKMTFPHMLSECHCLGSSLMRKQALQETNLDGGFVRYQDWDRWISMLEAGWLLGLVPEPLFMYRQHGDSLSHSTTANTEKEVFSKILHKHQETYKQYSLEVIANFHYRYWEVVEGKQWLENQYNNLNKEISRLQNIISQNASKNSIKNEVHRVKSKISRIFCRKDRDGNQ